VARRSPQAVAEIRWFWRDQLPERLGPWFCEATSHGGLAAGDDGPADLSAPDADRAGLPLPWSMLTGEDERELDVQESGPDEIINAPPFVGPVRRWTIRTRALDERVSAETEIVERRRWFRIFDTSDGWAREIACDARGGAAAGKLWTRFGCVCELARLHTTNGAEWWTLGLEAFGDAENVVRNLSLVAAALAARRPPLWARGLLASYPQWLRHQKAQTPSLQTAALA
jgi:hypothetical protein